MNSHEKLEQLRRLLADVFGTRIVDVEDNDLADFLRYAKKHGFMLVHETGIVR